MRAAVALMLTAQLGLATFVATVLAAELQVVRTRNVRDLVITVLTESGQLSHGRNALVLEFDSAPRKRLIDVGTVALSATMAKPGAPAHRAHARLSPTGAPGRYAGAIDLPQAGEWRIEVSWDGPAGKGSSGFVVPVQ